jgi:FMN phosphatase YigB (HAD superfamily)
MRYRQNMSSVNLPVSDPRRTAVIFDIDGTLCDVRLIRHFVQAPHGATKFKPNFDRFHAASINCPPHHQVLRLALRAHALGLAIVIVTGREAKWAGLTAEWLDKHHIRYDELRTRQAKDYRPDHIAKAEIERDVSQEFRAVLAVDDRLDIIEVWQAAKIPTVQITAEGDILDACASPGASLDVRVLGLLAKQVAS